MTPETPIRETPSLAQARPPRPRLTWRQGMLSALFGAWLITGLFIDGWAHNHQKPETIFTPWHLALYSGFAACALYAISILRKTHVPGMSVRDAAPVGHALVLLGVAIFGVGASSDLAWHSLFGIEASLDALLSPTHLVMFIGALLVLTGPFRAGWADARQHAPTLRQFLPTLISLALAMGLVAFFFQYVNPLRRDEYGAWVSAYATFVTRFKGAADGIVENMQIVGLTSVLITNLLYVAPLVLVLRRWRPPFGTTTVLFSALTALVGGLDAYARPWPLLAAVPAGLLADVLIGRLRPSEDRPWAAYAVAAATSAALWLGFFGIYQVAYGIGWTAELWTGSIVIATISALAASVLVFPPRVPIAASSAG